MPLTGTQIIARANSKAKTVGFTTGAQQSLNVILSDLCQDFDFAQARGLFTGTFNPGLTETINGVIIFGGPITLPADYLRTSGSSGSSGAQDSAWWENMGVPYPMTPCDLAEFDMQVQQAGLQNFPWQWVTDMSQSPPVAFVYPPPSGSYPFFVRYQRQMPDIVNFDNTVPWFPNQEFLITKLTGIMMQDSDDSRADKTLDNAEAILRRYMRNRDDTTNRAQTVQLDRRNFGSAFSRLKNTKQVGW